MLGPPKKQPPLRVSTIVYPEKHTQDFVSIEINVSKPTKTNPTAVEESLKPASNS
jgi:hypothetical protein